MVYCSFEVNKFKTRGDEWEVQNADTSKFNRIKKRIF